MLRYGFIDEHGVLRWVSATAHEKGGQSAGGKGYFALGTKRWVGVLSIPDDAKNAGLFASIGRERG